MKTLEIPGGTADLRDNSDLKVRNKRVIEVAQMAAGPALAKLPEDRVNLEQAKLSDIGVTAFEANTLFELQDAVIVARLDSWTLSTPIPTLDTLGDLDPELYAALVKATASMGPVDGSVDFDPTDPSGPGFEASPTPPSDGSAAGSRDEQGSSSTATLPTTGPSTSSAAPSPA